jgi:A1 cistron-splicing factor AAR2
MAMAGEAGDAESDAAQRFAEGACVVLEDVPKGSQVALDLTEYTTAERFRGWKMVPPGLHFLAHSAGGSGSEARVGEFMRAEPGGTFVRHWDTFNEALAPGQGCSDEKAVELSRAARSMYLDSQLAPYPSASLASWQRITTCLSDDLLSRCSIPKGTSIMPGDPDMRPHERYKHAAIMPFFCSSPRAPTFSDVSTRTTEGLEPSDVTAFHRGAGSARLRSVLSTCFDDSAELFVGEFQLAFVLFLMLASLRAFEQWKRLLEVVSLPDSSASEFAELYHKLTFSMRFLMSGFLHKFLMSGRTLHDPCGAPQRCNTSSSTHLKTSSWTS